MKFQALVAVPFVGIAMAGAGRHGQEMDLAARAIPNICNNNGVPDSCGSCAYYAYPGGGGQEPPVLPCMDRYGNPCASDVDMSTCCCGCCCSPVSIPQLPPCSQVADPLPEKNCNANVCVNCCDCVNF